VASLAWAASWAALNCACAEIADVSRTLATHQRDQGAYSTLPLKAAINKPHHAYVYWKAALPKAEESFLLAPCMGMGQLTSRCSLGVMNLQMLVPSGLSSRCMPSSGRVSSRSLGAHKCALNYMLTGSAHIMIPPINFRKTMHVN
jgi:hypothetical protein